MSMGSDLVRALISIAKHAPESIRQQELVSFMELLTGQEARGMVALMRVGQGMSRFDSVLFEVDTEIVHKPMAIAQIVSNAHLAENLTRALALALARNVDLNRFLRIRSPSQRRSIAIECTA